MDLKNRKVFSFRAHIDPMIGPKPRNSFDRRELKNWEFELTPAGVYVKTVFQTPGKPDQESEHIVPFTNIQSIKLMPLEKAVEKTEEKKAA